MTKLHNFESTCNTRNFRKLSRFKSKVMSCRKVRGELIQAGVDKDLRIFASGIFLHRLWFIP